MLNPFSVPVILAHCVAGSKAVRSVFPDIVLRASVPCSDKQMNRGQQFLFSIPSQMVCVQSAGAVGEGEFAMPLIL